jgi:predicted RNA-binding Zn-ribbon protein involved in translation (DUF1610 family)
MTMRGGSARSVTVVCPECGATHDLETAVAQRPFVTPPTLVKRVGEGGVEHGIACPDCGHWTHAHFETARLSVSANEVEAALLAYQKRPSPKTEQAWRRRKRLHQGLFTRVNSLLREALGLSSPSTGRRYKAPY